LLTNNKVKSIFDESITKVILVGWLAEKDGNSEAKKAAILLNKVAGRYLWEVEILLEETATNTQESAQLIFDMLWTEKEVSIITSSSHLKRATKSLEDRAVQVKSAISSEQICQQKLGWKWKTHPYHRYFWFLEKFGPLLYKINPKLIWPIKQRANKAL
jgi:hypothetical protein